MHRQKKWQSTSRKSSETVMNRKRRDSPKHVSRMTPDWLNCNERECVWRGLDRDIERGIAFTTNSDGFNEGYIKKHSDCLTTISLYQIQMLSGTLIFQIINYSLLNYKDIYYKENICTFKNITREMTSVSCEIGTVRGGANGRKWFIYSGTGIEYTSKISDM